RNMDDEQLLALKKTGGVVQIVAFASYLKTEPTGAGAGAGRGGPGTAPSGPPPCPVEAPVVPLRTPVPDRATVKDLVDHIDYAVKRIGIDHVGIASDFDGGGGVEGWNGADETFNVTLELVRRGYSEKDIARLWSGNLLRVWRDVEKVAKRLQRESK